LFDGLHFEIVVQNFVNIIQNADFKAESREKPKPVVGTASGLAI